MHGTNIWILDLAHLCKKKAKKKKKKKNDKNHFSWHQRTFIDEWGLTMATDSTGQKSEYKIWHTVKETDDECNVSWHQRTFPREGRLTVATDSSLCMGQIFSYLILHTCKKWMMNVMSVDTKELSSGKKVSQWRLTAVYAWDKYFHTWFCTPVRNEWWM